MIKKKEKERKEKAKAKETIAKIREASVINARKEADESNLSVKIIFNFLNFGVFNFRSTT